MGNNYAYRGQYLVVDLSSNSYEVRELEECFYRMYMGGVAAALSFILNEMSAEVDPLGPDNMLVLSCGLLAGTGSPCTPRYVACAKSPLTGAIAKSESGGWWGPELKSAGFDGVVVKGKAEHPVYLWIKDGQVEIRDAGHLWGKVTGEVQLLIKEELAEPRARILQIGPAGENTVRYANICNELSHFNGRSGMGAVMGSKNLKAIAVKGSSRVEVSEREKVQEVSRWVAREFKNHPQSSVLYQSGTAVGIEVLNAAGSLPTNNWRLAAFEHAAEIGSQKMEKEIFVSRGGCHGCPIRCKRVVEVKESGLEVDRMYGGPEYESLASLGSNCGIKNLHLLAKANELCNKYTLDTISTGMTISFAMDCFERGVIDEEDTGGLRLNFGNEEALLPLIEQIAHRQGFGDILAEGSKRAAARLGRGAEASLLQVKGQELPFHDPRTKTGLGLQYAVSPYGADHWFAQHDTLFANPDAPSFKGIAPLGIDKPVSPVDISFEKVRLFYYTSMMTSMYDCLGVCVFGAVSRSILPLSMLVDLVKGATGWETSLWELMKVGERAINMARVFNIRAGFGRSDDELPPLFFSPLKGGPLDGTSALKVDQFREALDLYYAMSGWDRETATPTKAKLYELNLGWLVE